MRKLMILVGCLSVAACSLPTSPTTASKDIGTLTSPIATVHITFAVEGLTAVGYRVVPGAAVTIWQQSHLTDSNGYADFAVPEIVGNGWTEIAADGFKPYKRGFAGRKVVEGEIVWATLEQIGLR